MDLNNQLENEPHPYMPVCSCGQCIKKRLTTSNFTKFPYSKNLTSIYNQEYGWKMSSTLPSIYYNKSKHTGFEGVYKEHLSSGLISTQKFDYKPYKVEIKDPKKENNLIQSLPFFGKSTYDTMYPNWGAANPNNKAIVDPIILNIPMRGNSNYAENYVRFPKQYYQTHTPSLHPKATLEFGGKFNPDTTNRVDYKAMVLKKNPAFTVEKFDKNTIEKSNLIPAPFPKSNMISTYGQYFIPLKNTKKCALNEYNKMLKSQQSLEN
jgi:hypothetical protein